MRCSWLFALAFAVLVACSNSTDGGGDGGNGFDAARFDFAGADLRGAPGTDGGAMGTQGCKTLALCEYNCNDNACVTACEAMATANAVNLYDAANQCATDWCLGTGGVGTSHCVLDANMNPVDPTGAAMGTCDNCLNDANALITPAPSACITPGGPDCNPAPCASAQNACLADG